MPSILSRLVYFLLLLPVFAVARSNSNVSVGMTLTADGAGAPWLSDSGDFAFGFHQLDKDSFLLAIWYNKIPEKTLVWYPNGANTTPRGSRVKLTAERGLVLNNPQNEELWRSPLIRGAVAYGILNDTGNFMLVGEGSKSLWESFKYPADTLLPTQILERSGVLSSRHHYNNFSRGRFEFRLLENGDVVLNSINMPNNNAYDSYYRSGISNSSNESTTRYRVIFHESGYLYIERKSGERYYLTEEQDIKPASMYYHKATLNFDGVFTMSQHSKNPTANDSWSDVRVIPDNICLNLSALLGSGTCGYNNICSLGENKRPICECLPRFSLNKNAQDGSCKPNFPQNCEEDGKSSPEALYELVELPNTDWIWNDFEMFSNYSLQDCKTSCLHNCLCVAAVYEQKDCYMKRLPLSNGKSDQKLEVMGILKLRKNNSTSQNPPIPQVTDAKDHDTSKTVVSALLGSSVFVNFLLVGTFCLGFWFYSQKKLKRIQLDKGVAEGNLRQFTYKELVEATNGFNQELGRGSCGIVYKGKIQNFPIAAKKLDKVFEDSDKEFKTEVDVIGKTHHKNLVRLIGYCTEGQHRVLVYEFLCNGSLASFLFREFKPSWSQRTNIAFEVARGLFYLHEECHTQIIHCDIKPQNILLDESYSARISDFGLAKLLAMNQSQTNTDIRGTKGYVAPEWFRTSPITMKVDVYSFGVLLLEIICCQRNVDIKLEEERKILTDWAYDCYQEDRLDALVRDDPEAIKDMKMLKRFMMVAIWCLQEDPLRRPTMKEVMLMLEGIVQVTVPPSPCPISSSS